MRSYLFFAFVVLTFVVAFPTSVRADFNCNRQLSSDTGNCVPCFRFWFGTTPPTTGCFTCSSFCFPFSPESEDRLSDDNAISPANVPIPDYAVIVDAQPCVGSFEAGLTEDDFEGQQVAMWTPTEVLDMFPPYALELESVELSGLPKAIRYALLMQRVDRGFINPIILQDFEARVVDFTQDDIQRLEQMGAVGWMNYQEENIDLAEFVKTTDRNLLLKIDPVFSDETGLHSRVLISIERTSTSVERSSKIQYEVVLGPVVSTAPVRYSDNYHGNVYSVLSISLRDQ